MNRLTEAQRAWLLRINNNGTWPDRPFLRSEEAGPLMRMGLVELIKPEPIPGRAPALPYATLTPAGRASLAQEGGGDDGK